MIFDHIGEMVPVYSPYMYINLLFSWFELGMHFALSILTEYSIQSDVNIFWIDHYTWQGVAG